MTTVADQIHDGIDSVLRHVQETYTSINYDPLLDELEEALEFHHSEMFDTETDPHGEPWKELSQVTIAKKGFDDILLEFGDLRGSLTEQTNTSIRQRSRDADGVELVFGTSDPKSHFHMDGTDRMPAREHVGLDELFVEDFSEDVLDFLVAELKE